MFLLNNNYVADDVDTCILRCAWVDMVYGRLALLCGFVRVSFELIAGLTCSRPISNSNLKFYLIVDLHVSSAILRCVLYCVIASYVKSGSLVSAICGL